ncbi:MAG TPA: c-type cytochrome [Thermohalobaculum sp.]|nr:c-type cytochrome [Thermohalobaculum sp.]
MISPIAIALAAAFTFTPAFADDPTDPAGATDIWEISRGGQLYDEWWTVIEAGAPEATHPAYPAAGKKSGATTWRCKECHGWDYRGAEGAYAKGSHFTGIKGISGMSGAPVDDIVKVLRGDLHGFTPDMLSDSAMRKLATFVSAGQIDDDLYIDRETKKMKGDPATGARYFQTICAVCHGYDGKAINFGDEEEPEFVGTVATDNPWEALHKVRFGQPGVGMVALSALDIQVLVDIVAYAQTLPE